MRKPPARRTLTVVDVMLLTGSAAVGFGLYQHARGGLFKGWVRLLDVGWGELFRANRTQLVLYFGDALSLLLPLAATWMFLIPVLRLRQPRPRWRRAWRQPGMAACLAGWVGWAWSGAGFALAAVVCRAASPLTIPPVLWVRFWLADEVFMYIGLAVAAVWTFLVVSGQWRRPADAVDRLGRVVGVIWLVVGIAWAARAYLSFLW